MGRIGYILDAHWEFALLCRSEIKTSKTTPLCIRGPRCTGTKYVESALKILTHSVLEKKRKKESQFDAKPKRCPAIQATAREECNVTADINTLFNKLRSLLGKSFHRTMVQWRHLIRSCASVSERWAYRRIWSRSKRGFGESFAYVETVFERLSDDQPACLHLMPTAPLNLYLKVVVELTT